MLSFVVVTLAAGLLVPPGQTATICSTTPAGVTRSELIAGQTLDDSTINLEGEWGITVNMGNVDDDPALEYACRLAKYNGSTYITRLVMLDDDQSILWSRTIGDIGNVEVCGFTLADINNDGKDEALFPNVDVYFNSSPQYKGRIYALNGATGTDLLGWPYILPGWPEDPYLKPYNELVVADLDNNGTKEILCEVTDNNSIRKCGSALYCFSSTGDSLWKFWFYQDTLDRHGQWVKPAVADIDGDSKLEIICHEAMFNGDNPWNLLERRLFILNYDGTLRKSIRTEGPGSSFTPDYAAPVVADLNQDGQWEIILLRRPGFLEVIDTAFNRWPGFPVDLHNDAGYLNPIFTRCFSTPAVADLDRDGDLEIVVGSFGLVVDPDDWGGHIHAFHHDGTRVAGFPYETRNAVWHCPGIANVDSQPGLEILTAACDSAFYVVSNTGESLPGWPHRGFPTYFIPDRGNHSFIEGRIPMSKTPQLTDIDDDGLIEMLMAGSNGLLYNLQTDGAFDTTLMPLPTFHYDKARTGWYRLSPTHVAETMNDERGTLNARPTIIRGIMFLPASSFIPHPSSLLDVSGRQLMLLRPGPNDVSHLPPGIYFATVYGARNTVYARKVILTR